MSDKSSYPYWRVIIGFTLCPAVVALFIVGAMMLFSLLSGQGFSDGWEIFGGLFVILFIAVLTALYLFGVPAFFLALLYILMRLRKSLYSYLVTFVAGGTGAQLWALLPIMTGGSDEGVIRYPGAFIMGAVSSLVMAFLVLPKHLEENHC